MAHPQGFGTSPKHSGPTSTWGPFALSLTVTVLQVALLGRWGCSRPSSCLRVPGPGLLSLASPPRGADIRLLSGAAFSSTCLPFLAEGLLPLPALKFMILLRQYRNLRSYFNTHFEGLSLTMARDIPSECSHLPSLFPLYRHYLLLFL